MTQTIDAQAARTNGVNLEALFGTIDAVKQSPEIAAFRFRTTNHWINGDKNNSRVDGFFGACEEHTHTKGPFTLRNGEPPILLGDGDAPNPVEYVLHALVGCMTTTMAYHAAARQIEITSIDSKAEGDLDLHGFLGLDETVRKGYSAIRVTMKVNATADAETLKALTRFSPVYDIVSNSVPVDVQLETTG